MTILVTGATGTVGRRVVEQLLERGERVRALTRAPERAEFPPGVDLDALTATSVWLAEHLGRPSPSRTVRALSPSSASHKE
ncbi:hypothetical protein ACZ90_62575 [Streptomyces albus subsp. albus]|nr:hypothetical protein ACZ90_62575 [Streptomyces albus subsp. albus]